MRHRIDDGSHLAPSSTVGQRVLVIRPQPDERPSTRSLDDIEVALSRRQGARVERWYLRRDPLELGSADPYFVVDDLRTWTVARLCERVLGARAAGRVRGLRLRLKLRRLAPDVVVLDDGLGGRVLTGRRRLVVHRLNGESVSNGMAEPISGPHPDLTIRSTAEGVGPLDNRLVRDLSGARSDGVRALDIRRRLAVAPDDFVVTGWGDGWLDGIDLFPRLLWTLEARHRLRAVGLWVADALHDDEISRLRAEASRCGVADRFHLVRTDEFGPAARLAGDVAVLPYRAPAEAGHLAPSTVAVAAGLCVVAFDITGLRDASVLSVPDLDLDAMAAAVAATDPRERNARIEATRQRLDVSVWSDDFLSTVTAIGRR